MFPELHLRWAPWVCLARWGRWPRPTSWVMPPTPCCCPTRDWLTSLRALPGAPWTAIRSLVRITTIYIVLYNVTYRCITPCTMSTAVGSGPSRSSSLRGPRSGECREARETRGRVTFSSSEAPGPPPAVQRQSSLPAPWPSHLHEPDDNDAPETG